MCGTPGAVGEIDAELRARVRELQEHRKRIARLAAGDSLALPAEVVTYLGRLREMGASEALLEGERDAWIVIAARWPDRMPEFMADKNAQLDDPRTVQVYLLISEIGQPGDDEARLVRLADMMAEQFEAYAAEHGLDDQAELMGDDNVVALLDAFAASAHPLVGRLRELLAERGWAGWIRLERA